MNDLQGKLAALSPEQRDRLMARLGLRADASAADAPASTPAPSPQAPGALAPAQQRMWLFEKLEGSASAYNIASVLRVRGALDVDALQWAVNDIIGRHEVLRTTFEEADGAPRARIAPQLEITVARVEFAPAAGQDREAALQRMIEAQVAVDFDLATGPLLRIASVRLAADESLIIAVFHHIVADGWSLRLLERELSQAYARALAGDRTQVPAAPVQYRDYVAWQDEWLREGGPRQLDYWKRTLDGGPGCWTMPTRQPREATRDLSAATSIVALPATLCARVRALAEAEKASAFMVLAAAFKVVLARLSGTRDLSLGTPVASRRERRFDPVIGLFSNTVVLRSSVEDGPFRDYLQQVRRAALGAFSHQDLPFEQVVDALRPERSSAHPPLFQVLFALQSTEGSDLVLPGLDVQPVHLQRRACEFDLIFEFFLSDTDNHAALTWRTALYDAPQIQRLQACFLEVLDRVVATPDVRIDALQAALAAPTPAAAADPGAAAFLAAQLPLEPGARVLSGTGLPPEMVRAVEAWARLGDARHEHATIDADTLAQGAPTVLVLAPQELRRVHALAQATPGLLAMCRCILVHGDDPATLSPVDGTELWQCWGAAATDGPYLLRAAGPGAIHHRGAIACVNALGEALPLDAPGELAVALAGRGPHRTGLRGQLAAGGVQVDGFIERHGWADGHAVPLERVEDALRRLPGVSAAAAVPRVDRDGVWRLVGYVAASQKLLPRHFDALVREAGDDTPLPSRYVCVSRIPRLRDGRLDLDALAQLPVLDAQVRTDAAAQLGCDAEALDLVWSEPPPLPSIAFTRPTPGASVVAEPAPVATAAAGSGRPALAVGAPLAPPKTAFSLVDVLRRAATEHGEHGVTYLDDASGTGPTQTYRELLDEASRVMAGLRAMGVRPGQRVLLQFASNRPLVTAFWGCVLCGAQPIPVALPRTDDANDKDLAKIVNAWPALRVSLVLTSQAHAPELERLAHGLGVPSVPAAQIEALLGHAPAGDWHEPAPDELALLLLTSGSTGLPKAVMQSHRALVSRSAATAQRFGFDHRVVSLNWMPLDHVGGLVMYHLLDVYLGARQYQCATAVVLEQPLRWIDWLSRHRVTNTWAPNFAYAVVNDLLADAGPRDWDLGALDFILNGGESIVPRTARSFLRGLAPYGLRGDAMKPAWGMSETCSGVTFNAGFNREASADEDSFVVVGSPIPGVSIRIVDADDRIVEEGRDGRLQISGPPVTPGYHNNPEATREAFTADGWYITGDLAVLREGSLTITGREKDLIIVNGLNYYGHEIEQAVESVADVLQAHVAACGVRRRDDNTDRLAIFFCVHERAQSQVDRVRAQIARTVLERVGIPASYLIGMAPEELPRTSIGKIQRPQLAQRFNQGEFDARLAARADDRLPAWFFEPGWRPLPRDARTSQERHVAVFVDAGLDATAPLDALSTRFARVVLLRAGEECRREGDDAFVVDPGDATQLEHVLRTLQAESPGRWRVVHCTARPGVATLAQLREDWPALHRSGLCGLLALAKAIAACGDGVSALDVVSQHAFAVVPGERPDIAQGAWQGFLRSLAQELPWLRCRQIDLDEVSSAALVGAVGEIAAASDHDAVALRQGRRYVQGLRSVVPAPASASALDEAGLCVVTGGLGGIGSAVCEWLLRHGRQHVLVLGRSELSTDAARRAIHDRLAATHGARFEYAVQDVCDHQGLQRLLEARERERGLPLRRVFHLAGAMAECTLLEETPAGLLHALQAKGLGALTLHQMLHARPDVEIVHFGSVNGFFGGVGVSAYAASNSLLDALVARRRAEGGACRCLHWSMWDDTGMSRGYGRQALVAARGFAVLDTERALDSLAAVLGATQAAILVGLDAGNPNIARHLDTAPAAYWRLKLAGPAPAAMPELRDAHGVRFSCLTDAHAGAGASSGRDEAATMTPREQQLAAIWQDVLRTPVDAPQVNFFELGGDSIMAIQVVARANKAGIAIAPRALFECQTLRELAQSAAGTGPEEDAPMLSGQVPLGPVQQWFFDQALADPQHMNQSALLRLRERVEPAQLHRALAAVVAHHDQLRVRFSTLAGATVQTLSADTDVPLEVIDLDYAACDAGAHADALRVHADRLQASLDLRDGSLFRAGYLRGRVPDEDRLLLVVHHLVIDGVSWRILLDDLETALERVRLGQAARLGRKSSDYGRWAAAAAAPAADAATLAHWQQACAQAAPLPAPARDVANLRDGEAAVEIALEPAATQDLLQRLPAAWGVGVNDLLLAALYAAWRDWGGGTRLLLTLEGHGRGAHADFDLSRTVGWFTAMYPVALEGDADASLAVLATHVRDCLAQVPDEGRSYLALRHGGDADTRAALAAGHAPLISFNYLGRFDVDPGRLLSFANESPGAQVSPRQARFHELDIVGAVVDGALRFSFVFNGQRHSPDRIRPFAVAFADALRRLSAQTATPARRVRLGEGVSAAALQASLAAKGIAMERVEAAFRATATQTGLIYESEVSGVDGTYVSHLVNELSGALDVAALRQAWQEVTDRHGVYRSAFLPSQQGHYLQVVLDTVPLTWTVLDWSGLPFDVQESRFSQLLADDSRRGFDLQAAPALRLHLVKMAPDRHRMLVSEHHCVSDGWSRGIVLSEVAALYRRHARGQAVGLAPPLSFERYAQWLAGFDDAGAERYWRELLHGAAPMPRYAGQRRPAETHRAPETGRRSGRLPHPVSAALAEAARARRVTLGALAQAAWALTMAAWTGQEDVTFLTTHAGRPAALEGVERIVGPLICTVPVRLDLRAQASLLQAARAFQGLQVDRNEHGYLPLAQACAAFAPERLREKFTTLFVFENFPLSVPEAEPGELQVAWVKSLDRSDLPLSIMVVPGAELEFVFYYRDDLFDAACIDRIMDSYARVLTLAARQPEAALDPGAWLDAQSLAFIASGLATRDATAAAVDAAPDAVQAGSTCTTF